jgi:methylenetetrahydrofolate dehydrogenase (NADP+)/methenyltetrahydrofolate cyclohydrolase
MTKILNGRELAGYIKERQAREVRSLRSQGIKPVLAIIRNNDSPVITKYVSLKQRYGDDIGIEVRDIFIPNDIEALKEAVLKANQDDEISGIIIQLPLCDPNYTDEIVKLITPEKDVDGLSGKGQFDSATATAINWLLSGYGVDLSGKKIAVVGRGRLVGAPLIRMWRNSGYDVSVFGHDGDLTTLPKYDIIVTATGVPHLIKTEMVAPEAIIVDAGTASEGGILVGDVDEAVRARVDLGAITPKIGGVGPLTVTVLFDDVIRAAKALSA